MVCCLGFVNLQQLVLLNYQIYPQFQKPYAVPKLYLYEKNLFCKRYVSHSDIINLIG